MGSVYFEVTIGVFGTPRVGGEYSVVRRVYHYSLP